MSALTRRRFLAGSASALALWLAGCRPGGERAVARVTATRPATPTPALTGERAARSVWLTPTAEFYRQFYLNEPQVDAAQWQLTVDGLVAHPLSWRYADIRALASVEEVRTLACIGNAVGGDQIGTATWVGARVADVLAEVGLAAGATRARFEAADGYSTAVDLAWLTQAGALLVYAMNGAELTAAHGYPVRLMLPGLYGQKQPKWITRIELIDHDYLGVWERQGWSDLAEVKTHSLIKWPRTGDSVRVPCEVYGMAWAGKRAITQVEVGVDGVWQVAELVQGASPLVWTQWYFVVRELAAGKFHTVEVRATDETGFVQSKRSDVLLGGAFPAGTESIHGIMVQAEGG